MLEREIYNTKVGLDRLSKIITSNHNFPLEEKWWKCQTYRVCLNAVEED